MRSSLTCFWMEVSAAGVSSRRLTSTPSQPHHLPRSHAGRPSLCSWMVQFNIYVVCPSHWRFQDYLWLLWINIAGGFLLPIQEAFPFSLFPLSGLQLKYTRVYGPEIRSGFVFRPYRDTLYMYTKYNISSQKLLINTRTGQQNQILQNFWLRILHDISMLQQYCMNNYEYFYDSIKTMRLLIKKIIGTLGLTRTKWHFALFDFNAAFQSRKSQNSHHITK